MADKKYTQGIYIDGVFYDIPFISIKRNADFLEKYAERVEAGDVKVETIGCYYNYNITVGYIDDNNLYNRLFEHLTQVEPRMHNVELPEGTSSYSFRGYFSSISDEISKVLDHEVKFESLKFKMTSQKPTKK